MLTLIPWRRAASRRVQAFVQGAGQPALGRGQGEQLGQLDLGRNLPRDGIGDADEHRKSAREHRHLLEPQRRGRDGERQPAPLGPERKGACAPLLPVRGPRPGDEGGEGPHRLGFGRAQPAARGEQALASAQQVFGGGVGVQDAGVLVQQEHSRGALVQGVDQPAVQRLQGDEALAQGVGADQVRMQSRSMAAISGASKRPYLNPRPILSAARSHPRRPRRIAKPHSTESGRRKSL